MEDAPGLLTGEDAAYDAENALITAVVTDATLSYALTWAGSDRDINDSGEWFETDVRFTVLHRIALS